MPRLNRKQALLVKKETTYATDAAPAVANAILATNVNHTIIEGEEVSRDLMLPYLGNQGVILAGTYSRLEFEVEVAGAGAAGTAPKYGQLLRSCGMSETIVASTSVTYAIVEAGIESVSIYFLLDGVRHILLGAVGTVSVDFTTKQIPKFKFSFIGLLGTVSDQAMPAVSQTGWVTPGPVSAALSTLTLFGVNTTAEQVSLDLGNTLTPRFLIGASDQMLISDRKAVGQAVVQAENVATADWFGRAMTRARGVLKMVHGTAAGNIVEFNAPAVEVGRFTQGQTDGIVNYSLPLSLVPVTGRDELNIVVR